MPIISIPIVAREKLIYYAAVITVEEVQLKGSMGDFFERRKEGYVEACCDLCPDAGGFLICDFEGALEKFRANPHDALTYLAEYYPGDFTTKRAIEQCEAEAVTA
jgi:hypothetical protein